MRNKKNRSCEINLACGLIVKKSNYSRLQSIYVFNAKSKLNLILSGAALIHT